MIEVHTTTPDETLAFGRLMAAMLTAGDVVLLSGRLGSGKTCLASGIADGLGIAEQVVSPSFLIVRQYRDGFLPLYHADVYRLSSMVEFEDLELVEQAEDGVLLVEWGEAVERWVPPDHLSVDIVVEPDESRTVRLVPRGEWMKRDLEVLA
jgi:tRNA threonylcarbamoyladenosine biosynthesis protein TsaE